MKGRSVWVGENAIRFSDQDWPDRWIGEEGLIFVPRTTSGGWWTCERSPHYALVYSARGTAAPATSPTADALAPCSALGAPGWCVNWPCRPPAPSSPGPRRLTRHGEQPPGGAARGRGGGTSAGRRHVVYRPPPVASSSPHCCLAGFRRRQRRDVRRGANRVDPGGKPITGAVTQVRYRGASSRGVCRGHCLATHPCAGGWRRQWTWRGDQGWSGQRRSDRQRSLTCDVAGAQDARRGQRRPVGPAWRVGRVGAVHRPAFRVCLHAEPGLDHDRGPVVARGRAGAVAVLGGLILIGSASRAIGLWAGWLTAVAGAWFAVGP